MKKILLTLFLVIACQNFGENFPESNQNPGWNIASFKSKTPEHQALIIALHLSNKQKDSSSPDEQQSEGMESQPSLDQTSA